MDLLTVFKQGDSILITVFCLLIMMSIVTWGLIILRFWHNHKVNKTNKYLIQQILILSDLNEIKNLTANDNAPVAKIVNQAIYAQNRYGEFQKQASSITTNCSRDEFLTRAIRQSLTNASNRFDNGLTALASIGATAPFIGLFGTVWGIYHALVNIGSTGQMSIAAVAGPIGEALVATAAGLATAIPAVLAYNALNRHNKVLIRQLDHFAYDLHAMLLFWGR